MWKENNKGNKGKLLEGNLALVRPLVGKLLEGNLALVRPLKGLPLVDLLKICFKRYEEHKL